ncbi:MAG TPA: right-handed parallel beta-helix repeat-containing protein [Bacteroides sp.]|nr:right-handed parallel beta-helix repeat-containing protein [Bacteroides sp.]
MKTLTNTLKTLFLPALIVIISGCSGTINTARYLDASNGDDSRDGKTPETAWKSLEKVNSVEFGPGAEILFKSGEKWTGELTPLGSGQEDKLIRIDKYGEGEKPVIHGDGGLFTIYLFNQEYWEISNLEITNYNALEEGLDMEAWEQKNISYWVETDTIRPKYTEERTRKTAILVEAEDIGRVSHLHFSDLEIHGVNGTIIDKHNGGLFLRIKGDSLPTYFDGLLVENCHFHDLDNTGMANTSSWMTRSLTENTNWVPSKNVVIRNNRFERTAANALIVRVSDSALIEHNLFTHCAIKRSGNAFYPFNCDNTIMQYNEACFTKYNEGDGDAGGFDSDWRSKNCLIQYNYSHDNEYGALLVCCNGADDGFNDGTIVRYNIFQNEGHHVIRVSGKTTNTTIHNNVIYTGEGVSEIDIIWHKSWNGFPDNTSYYNNIFYNLGADNRYEFSKSTNNLFSHNIFYGKPVANEPVDENKIISDPMFIDPGSGGMGFSSIEGYKINQGSPAINTGKIIPGNVGVDLWGNEITENQSTDRGVMEFK